jgi:hypothetical protein
MCVLANQYFKDINLEKHCKTMSKWMVIVKLWENGDKLGKIKYLWSNEEMIDDINLDFFIASQTFYFSMFVTIYS